MHFLSTFYDLTKFLNYQRNPDIVQNTSLPLFILSMTCHLNKPNSFTSLIFRSIHFSLITFSGSYQFFNRLFINFRISSQFLKPITFSMCGLTQVIFSRLSYNFTNRSILDLILSSSVASFCYYALNQVSDFNLSKNHFQSFILKLVMEFFFSKIINGVSITGILSQVQRYTEIILYYYSKLFIKLNIDIEVPIPEIFECPICKDCLKETVESQKCFFCKNCFDEWISYNQGYHPVYGTPFDIGYYRKALLVDLMILKYKQIYIQEKLQNK